MLVRAVCELILLPAVLRLRFVDSLPLHVAGVVRAAPFQGNDVIDDVARAAMGKSGYLHKLVLSGFTANDPSM